MKIGVIVAAAGSGQRMGAEGNKVLLPLHGKPMLQYSLECFHSLEEIVDLVVVSREADLELVKDLAEKACPGRVVQVVPGGAERQESVYKGLKALPPDTDWAIIHDGARPFLTQDMVRRGLAAAREYGAVALAVPVKDTIKQVREGVIVDTPPRQELWAAQTPQIFRYELILRAHEQAREQGTSATDDCALVEALGHPVYVAQGDYGNVKITTPDDLPGSAVGAVGFGYDVHRLVPGRKLILGGVEIPFDRGLLGHSDADVLTHAVMDALLGAMGEGDIGELFPDTDPRYAGISSLVLLSQVRGLMQKRSFAVANLDAVILAQQPKLSPWKEAIRARLASELGVSESRINIKASTTEGLGFVGREEGIAVQAVVMLRSGQC
ncbi:MAG TPA: 2-C-methyl-D-erythritol 4-phosphate cytidylyltransferase [Firmicutes bacterium]|jgi:2-C-methyl-D-erythritol 4-phosphate cytidylyltransferase/2-C-methyl-D-erythritol 2,4-cyclodiphosphate synthase|nr:2-C-methyl-D-erythritol 4-phosphate cytidylyltransferase [Bacillota bacterium]